MSYPSFIGIDIGNSAVKMALHDGLAWGEPVVWPLPYAYDVPPEEWTEVAASFARAVDVRGAAIASVVPALTPRLEAAVREGAGLAPAHLSAESPLPFAVRYGTPGTLGADRLAAAAGAWHHWAARDGGPPRPVVVIDAGSAITVDVVAPTPDGPTFLGGAIAPGPDMLRRALAEGAAQLPEVAWEPPARPIGTTTAEAMQAGLTAFVEGGLERLIAQADEALGQAVRVVATGGHGRRLAERLTRVEAYRPLLVFEGLRVVFGPPRPGDAGQPGGQRSPGA
ncbi:MAG: type III pantothenate kinase [Rubricoccaceae bacterium]